MLINVLKKYYVEKRMVQNDKRMAGTSNSSLYWDWVLDGLLDC